MTQPHLEVVEVGPGESFKIWAHGYPCRTVRWHYHPEYEIHLVTATRGTLFVGDHIGTFEPGNLVMTGPNLPHNWLSDIPDGGQVTERCLVLQFTAAFANNCSASFPELGFLSGLLDQSARGLLFDTQAGRAAEPIMRALLIAHGAARLSPFFDLLELLRRCATRQPLASAGFEPGTPTYLAQPLNHILHHISRNLTSDLRESELAELSGLHASTFSRAFQRQTGLTFVRYVNGLRINRACEMLVATERRIADICFDAGFNNLSNFNRQFQAMKHMSPRTFRRHHRAKDPIPMPTASMRPADTSRTTRSSAQTPTA